MRDEGGVRQIDVFERLVVGRLVERAVHLIAGGGHTINQVIQLVMHMADAYGRVTCAYEQAART